MHCCRLSCRGYCFLRSNDFNDIEFLHGTPAGDPLGVVLSGHIASVTGRDPAFEMCPGLLETRFYAAHGVPAFAYGPGLLTVSHGPNEFVPIRNIVRCAEIYALTAAWTLR